MSASGAHNGISSEGGGSPGVEGKLTLTKEELAIKARLLAETRMRFTKLKLMSNNNLDNLGVAGQTSVETSRDGPDSIPPEGEEVSYPSY